ncbi:zf-HC2 domain-containing protein [Aureibacter tunicatorum]|uniref:Anti-sigma-YlaC factor YlaD n=1 Tax=Aureibacter tunicatorum TaxID=866807 RepID=A0AAE3XJY8_9BACT|nr:zf-HC2 domain-containing protein [Aureibacter tunicatorum]MDR6237802.1 putative anti-sigma-YlaC factor YlaD [Aureibacter tunicatorum]BDD02837.1 hypothetical protein AUTU_03200 [Aureibacter tunicatorum]
MKLFYDCNTATRLMIESEDRELTKREKILLRLHLMTCKLCRNYQKQMKGMAEYLNKHFAEEHL